MSLFNIVLFHFFIKLVLEYLKLKYKKVYPSSVVIVILSISTASYIIIYWMYSSIIIPLTKMYLENMLIAPFMIIVF